MTDTRLRHLKPKEKLYKVNDRDGLYVAVTPAGSISFRYNYSINGRQETVTFGRYGVGGITLAEARERLNEAKKMVAGGRSPAREKARDKARIKDAETFGVWVEKWLRGYQMAESTRDMRRSVYQRELKSKFAQQKLTEFTHEDLRALTDISVGLQLFTMGLLVGIGKSFIDQYYQAMGSGAIHFKSMFVMLVASIILLVLVNKVPPMIGNIPGGASMGGIGGFGAGALMGAAGSASAAITAVSGALVSGGGWRRLCT